MDAGANVLKFPNITRILTSNCAHREIRSRIARSVVEIWQFGAISSAVYVGNQ